MAKFDKFVKFVKKLRDARPGKIHATRAFGCRGRSNPYGRRFRLAAGLPIPANDNALSDANSYSACRFKKTLQHKAFYEGHPKYALHRLLM
jgi:hypothetical protein